mmetsp:Transcript_21077/g.60145  ORF Transcript_21077/g.60145 Transcript_21077/m.60145 type:complete len:173 (+) Transcript_21077:54-572(+)
MLTIEDRLGPSIHSGNMSLRSTRMQPFEHAGVANADDHVDVVDIDDDDDDDDESWHDGIQGSWHPPTAAGGLSRSPYLRVAVLGLLVTLCGYYAFGRTSVRRNRAANNESGGNGVIGDDNDGPPKGDGHTDIAVSPTTLLSLPGCDDYECQTDRSGHGWQDKRCAMTTIGLA